VSVESIINNPSPAFLEPCEACGVSEFQLGVKSELERIIELLEHKVCADSFCAHDTCVHTLQVIELIKGEQK
jgi:hypothetical protein